MTKNKNKKNDYKKFVEDFSLKELTILVFGIIIIFAIIIFAPKMYNNINSENAKTLDEMHIDNYNNPDTENSFIYNGFSFIKISDDRTSVDFWYTQYENNGMFFNIPFRYNPIEIENITQTILNHSNNTKYKNIYITVDPNDEPGSQKYIALAVSEFVEILSKVKNYPMIGACTRNETKACIDRPIINCNNRGDFLTFYFKEASETAIYINNNCITVQGNNESIIKATDKTIYGFLGIIK
jgi:hypothetical protein